MAEPTGKANLDIKYCVASGYFWQAANAAAELTDGRIKETNIRLTPVGGGRFEIYVNDEKIYDRLAAGEGNMWRGEPFGTDEGGRQMRQARRSLIEALERAQVAV